MKIIGLTGFAKSGKSTAAEVLKSLGGQEIAFAKHLKDVCAVVLGIPRSKFDDQNWKEVEFNIPVYLTKANIVEILEMFEVAPRLIPGAVLEHSGKYLRSPRHVAQYVGTEILRGLDTNIHINMALRLNSETSAPFFVCSDVRFENELISVQRENGIIIGISRKAATPADLSSLHPSEAEIPELISRSDFEVANENTIDSFKSIVASLANQYTQK